MRRHAALLLLLRAKAGCEGNCAAPINVTGSVLSSATTTNSICPSCGPCWRI